jgi:hypothetical protein
MIALHVGKGSGANRRSFCCGSLLRRAPTTIRRSARYTHERFSGMDAIAAIAVFLVALAALNRYEFGRFD